MLSIFTVYFIKICWDVYNFYGKIILIFQPSNAVNFKKYRQEIGMKTLVLPVDIVGIK